MNKDEIIKELSEDQDNGNGKIIEIAEDGVLYYDYENCETFYRFAENCTKEEITPLFFICDAAKERGVTADFLFHMLQEAFKEDFADAMCTLNGVVITDKENFFHFLDQVDTHEGSNLEEFYEWEELDNCVGKMFCAHKIAVVNHQVIAELSKQLADELYSKDEEYAVGIIQTVIHEIRHLMIDTNPFLPMNDEDQEEEAVESFCRRRYDSLPEELQCFASLSK